MMGVSASVVRLMMRLSGEIDLRTHMLAHWFQCCGQSAKSRSTSAAVSWEGNESEPHLLSSCTSLSSASGDSSLLSPSSRCTAASLCDLAPGNHSAGTTA